MNYTVSYFFGLFFIIRVLEFFSLGGLRSLTTFFDKPDGKSINSIDAEGYSTGVKVYGKEDWINGKWFAPDWTKVQMNSGRTPNRKSVPDWVAQQRYYMPSVASVASVPVATS